VVECTRALFFSDRDSKGYKQPCDDIVKLCDTLTPSAVAWVCLGVTTPSVNAADAQLWWGLRSYKVDGSAAKKETFSPFLHRHIHAWTRMREVAQKRRETLPKLLERCSRWRPSDLDGESDSGVGEFLDNEVDDDFDDDNGEGGDGGQQV
jgi:hypothetical protein